MSRVRRAVFLRSFSLSRSLAHSLSRPKSVNFVGVKYELPKCPLGKRISFQGSADHKKHLALSRSSSFKDSSLGKSGNCAACTLWITLWHYNPAKTPGPSSDPSPLSPRCARSGRAGGPRPPPSLSPYRPPAPQFANPL
jgi:hypothetical protein